MKQEGECEYQMLNNVGNGNGRLTAKDIHGNWMLKGVPWKLLSVGQVITKDMQERLYGALWKLMEYEDIGYSPENVEHIRYVLEDAVKKIEECHRKTELTKEIWHYLKDF